MERFVKISSSTDRSFVVTNPRTNTQETVPCKGFLLSDNTSTFYGEMVGKPAEEWKYQGEGIYLWNCKITARQRTDKDGVLRFENPIRINSPNLI
jgi:hypothetical protein